MSNATKPTTPDLMTIDDLAARWGITVEMVKRQVRSAGVPFFALNPTVCKISWAYVRFRVEAIEEWEKSRTGTFDGQPQPQPTTRLSLAIPNLDWRKL